MGMMIDIAIKILEHYNNGFCETSGGLSEPIKVAIETMRKYQKIENLWADFNNGEYDYAPFMRALREVLEDGKID